MDGFLSVLQWGTLAVWSLFPDSCLSFCLFTSFLPSFCMAYMIQFWDCCPSELIDHLDVSHAYWHLNIFVPWGENKKGMLFVWPQVWSSYLDNLRFHGEDNCKFYVHLWQVLELPNLKLLLVVSTLKEF